MLYRDLLQELQESASRAGNADAVMRMVATRLHETIPRYNWVGFYLIDPSDSHFLIIGPYAGSFSPNLRIPLNKGLCGAAAASGQSVVVNDVSKDGRYLSGSSLVKSEIVVPLFAKKKLVAELDIESYFQGTFTNAEEEFVRACAALVEERC